MENLRYDDFFQMYHPNKSKQERVALTITYGEIQPN